MVNWRVVEAEYEKAQAAAFAAEEAEAASASDSADRPAKTEL